MRSLKIYSSMKTSIKRPLKSTTKPGWPKRTTELQRYGHLAAKSTTRFQDPSNPLLSLTQDCSPRDCSLQHTLAKETFQQLLLTAAASQPKKMNPYAGRQQAASSRQLVTWNPYAGQPQTRSINTKRSKQRLMS